MTAFVSAPLPLPAGSVRPDYGAGGLFGLVTGVRQWLLEAGHGEDEWAVAALPPPRARVLVFLLVDGLGDRFLRRFGAGSLLLEHRRGSLTSVFPSTTASAVTTVLTGLPPLSHGLTGWFVQDRRFGGIIAPLPMIRRAGGAVRGPFRLQRLFPYRTVFDGARRRSMFVSPAYLAGSAYSRRHGRGAEIVPYRGLNGLVEAVASGVAALAAAGGGYLHAYYPKFDALCHRYGATSEQAIEELACIDAAFGALLGRLAGADAEIVVSADHGFIDAPADKRVDLHRRPAVTAMLAAPLFGERRAAWCEVRPGAAADFEAYAREELAGKAVVVPSARVAAAGLLGHGTPHRRLRERLGTHALLMEPGWTVCDRLPGERLPLMIGMHGGLSAEEMWIPLVHAAC